MTKQEFVDQVANSSGLGKSEAGKAVDAVLDTIQETLSRGGEVSFTGFGKFTVADRGARQGVNPQTGERIQIAASRVPRFSAGSALKTAVKTGSGGELGEPVREITIASDLVSMLRSVIAVGREARWAPFGGSVRAAPLLLGEMAVSGS